MRIYINKYRRLLYTFLYTYRLSALYIVCIDINDAGVFPHPVYLTVLLPNPQVRMPEAAVKK